MKRSFYVRESELDDFQRQVINRKADRSLIIKGCAGSGKSILALWKAKDILDSGKGSLRVVVFTKALSSFMQAAMRSIGLDRECVTYYWEWEHNNHGRTKYLIVDEAQDFSERQIRAFMSAAEIVIFCGDDEQQIYSFRGRDPKDAPIGITGISRLSGFPEEQLVFNHRLPKKIACVAECLNCKGDPLEARCKNEGEDKPLFVQADSLEAQIDMMVQTIRDRGFEDIGILLPRNSDVQQVADSFKRKGMVVEAKVNREMSFNWGSPIPKVMTYHSSKGLQFEAVFLPLVDQVNEGFEKPLYVAMTRTYQSLYVLYQNALPPFLSNIPSDLYEMRTVQKLSAGVRAAPAAHAVDYDADIPF